MTENRDAVIFHAAVELQVVQAGDFTREHVNNYWANVLHQAAAAAHPPAWCGAFALWCLHQAGLGPELKWEFGPPHYGFLWALERIGSGEAPKPGDVGYQDQPYRHHFLVQSVDGNDVHTIEGNQGEPKPIQAHVRHLHDPGVVYFSISRLLPERDYFP